MNINNGRSFSLATGLMLLFAVASAFTSCGHKSGAKDASASSQAQNADTVKAKDTSHANLASKDVNTEVVMAGGVMVVTNTVIQNISSPKEFSRFITALKKTGLDKVLDSRGPFTVFLPNDDAFLKLDQARWNAMLEDKNKGELEKFVKFHIIAGQVKTHDMIAGSSLTTIGGNQLVVIIENGKTKIMDGNGNLAEIIKPDLLSKNGIIHVTDAVLMPKGMGQAQ